MSKDVCREAFEEWVQKRDGYVCLVDEYNPFTYEAWKAAWQARDTAIQDFDEISIDVSTGERDAGLRAFASMPPNEIMESKGKRIALFEGYLNHPAMKDVSDWQPIETAPRDGTQFLVWCCETGKNGFDIGRWHGSDPRTAYYRTNYGWRSVYWMPILPLPTKQKEG